MIHIDFFLLSIVNCTPFETDGETTEKGDQTVTGRQSKETGSPKQSNNSDMDNPPWECRILETRL